MKENDFWVRVKELMASQKLIQQDMADIAGVSIGVFKNWLSRGIMPNCDQACLIADKLNTSVEYLVTGKECSNQISSDGIELLQMYNSVPDNFKTIAKNSIKAIMQQFIDYQKE